MNKTKKIIIGILIILGSAFAIRGIAETVKLNPIKPGTKATAQISDEQQAILAVRLAKASVVNIVGTPKAAVPVGNAPQIFAVPDSVSGTGFVLEADGLIVTNNHVVDRDDLSYSVIFPDGAEYGARVSAADKFDDVAFLKIDAKNLTPAKLGNSNALETGQSVFAIGNSLGKYEFSVTRGVISGLARSVETPGGSLLPSTHAWIQTDAAINPGNSGGPLINLAGEVVGMNTLIDTSGSSLGFALPANLIKEAGEQLRNFGKVSRPFLGIKFRTVDTQLRLEKNLPASQQGAYVFAVNPGTAAAAAGLGVGDIIVAINGQKLDLKNELTSVIQKYQAGSQVTFKILRANTTLELPVILGELK